jgi:hypothetical protein
MISQVFPPLDKSGWERRTKILRPVYGLLAASLIAFGGYWAADGFLGSEFFRELDVIIGFAFALVGVMNVLNLSYGQTARSVQIAAAGSDLALFGFFLRGEPPTWLVILFSCLVLLSIDRISLGRGPEEDGFRRSARRPLMKSLCWAAGVGLSIIAISWFALDPYGSGGIIAIAVSFVAVMTMVNVIHTRALRGVWMTASAANFVLFGIGLWAERMAGLWAWREIVTLILLFLSGALAAQQSMQRTSSSAGRKMSNSPQSECL